jgi:hypothetical protein
LESNLKYEATLKNKKLRDIDLVIKGAADAMTKDGYGIGIDSIAKGNHRRWYKRYNALMKPKKPTTPEGTFENDLLPRRLP